VVSARALAPIGLLAAVFIVGCQAETPPDRITAGASRLVLQPSDIPEGLSRFDAGPLGGSRTIGSSPGPRPRSAWIARYRQVDPAETDGPLVIESLAAVFPDESGAVADHEQRRRDLGNLPDAEVRSVPRLGHATFAVTYGQQALPRDVQFFVVAWRHGNATASVTVQGFEGKISLEDAVSLARLQEAHLEEAA
jgi:hypothetical protein